MKSKMLLFARSRAAAHMLLVGFALLTWSSASAQNLVKNPDFEEPLGPDNWTFVYVLGGPNDFFIKGRTRLGHKDLGAPNTDTWDGGAGGATNYWNKLGLDIKAGNDALIHAYCKQTVTGLTANASYTVSAWITQFEGPVDKVKVYLEVLGGASGTVSQRTADITTTSKDNPAGWNRYTLLTTASTNGQVEIRLRYNKDGYTSDKWRTMDALYDHVSLMRTTYYPTSQPTPPFKILSFVRTNEEIALTWATVMNSRYRVQASTNLSDPNSWVMLERPQNVDTNFAATGTNFTFKTNVSALFYYNPPSVRVPVYLDPDVPLFFRIYSENFQP